MSRPTVGLALGGGGARGLAHIGILKVFEQENLPIDFLSGTSMGGVIAAGYAAGLNATQLEAIALDLSDLRNMVRLLDVRPGRNGLLEGKRMREFLVEKMRLDLSFDQLRLPLAVTATDFLRGKEMVLKSGSVIDAVMATCAFPGIFQPVYCDDKMLVDGGVLDNVPAGVARFLGAQVVIAVAVTPQYPREEISVELMNRRLLPPIFPSFSEEIYRAAMVMSAEITRIRIQEAQPEVVLYPEIPEDVSIFLGFPHAVEIIALGEAAACQALPQIRQAIEERTKKSFVAKLLEKLYGRPK